jgi:hypothetical protein
MGTWAGWRADDEKDEKTKVMFRLHIQLTLLAPRVFGVIAEKLWSGL